ncbi:MAG: 2TM domain-containing protein [Acidimicrobiia bacterium]|nr:2TM domain-containing protein [Acidimicrobiia bacterium]
MVQEVPMNTGATNNTGAPLPTPTEAELREIAIKRLKKKRDFRNHLFTYVVINTMLWSIWIIAGVVEAWAFPWPLFPTVVWGLFVLGHYRDTYLRNPFREERVQREIESLRAASRTHPIDTYGLED